VIALWEAEDEPWVYVASQDQPIERHPPTRFGEADGTLHPDLRLRLDGGSVISAPFHTEHLAGHVFFSAPVPTLDLQPMTDVVAREVGNSLDQVYLAARDRQLAVREDRLRVARDLHDGVLQALTGIRLELQALAESAGEGLLHDRLLASERALAVEQRELRRFIDGLRPGGAGVSETGSLSEALTETSRRLTLEWRTAVTVRINPPTLSLPPDLERGVRLLIHEAVINALKHATPTRVTVRVDASQSDLTIVIADDGTGFPFKGTLDHEALGAAGPASLRDRVTALSGRMTISSSSSGSRVDVTVPMRAGRAALG
jgi:signal transduction histidine kinase